MAKIDIQEWAHKLEILMEQFESRLAAVEDRIRELLPDFTLAKPEPPAPGAPILEEKERIMRDCYDDTRTCQHCGYECNKGDPCPKCAAGKPPTATEAVMISDEQERAEHEAWLAAVDLEAYRVYVNNRLTLLQMVRSGAISPAPKKQAKKDGE